MANTTKKPESEKAPKTDKAAAKAAKAKTPKEASAGAETSAKTAENKRESSPAKKSGKPAVKRRPLMPQTYFAKPGEQKNRWRLVDAKNQPLGRLSTHIVTILMGKDKPGYTRHIDTGDFVIVINAKEVLLTGNKLDQKNYYSHSGFPGGLRTATARDVLGSHPERIIEKAVWRMLPKNKQYMTRHWFKKLKVFSGSEHTHTAQQPVPANLPNLATRKEA